jgi:hypothetical protein
MFALSLISFGSTIWPRSSTLIKDSILQQLKAPPAASKQDPVLAFFFILSSKILELTEYSEKSDYADIISLGKWIVKGLQAGNQRHREESFLDSGSIDFPLFYLVIFFSALEVPSMAKIWFGRPGTQPDQGDLKEEKEISWCLNHLGPLTFISPSGRLPKMPDEESSNPPSMRNYKFVVVEIEEENGDLKPGYYFSRLTPKEVWEML